MKPLRNLLLIVILVIAVLLAVVSFVASAVVLTAIGGLFLVGLLPAMLFLLALGLVILAWEKL